MSAFEYDSNLLDRYPGVVGGVIIARGLQNGPTSDSLRQVYLAEQQAVLARLGDTPLSQLPSISAWRSAFSRFGVEPTKYRSAAESLLRRLTKKGDLPLINTLVDIGNLVSIRHTLPVAVIDLRPVQEGIRVRFAEGSERFSVLNESGETVENPQPGEVIFTDATNLVFSRRWCWRQSDQSAAQPDTTDALITVEAHHTTAQSDIEAALADLTGLLHEFAGGTYRTGLASSANPRVQE
ncbi:MAG TPA: phenylalanine--tRNA ligase beta subunit-related protein [Chloroflexia bacterium]|nr:phenylalanine--tRNA ligase beta subunit-related protein [Chloroflexia bacterium]